MPTDRHGVRARAFGVAGAIALLLAGSTALGAEPTAAQIKQARQLFTEAEALRAAGRCDEAVGKLRQALAIKETPGLRFHAAFCEEQLGHLVQASADYARAAELIRAGAVAPDVARLLEPAQQALSERVPTVQLRVSPEVPGARVSLDDKEIVPAALGGALPMDPGSHVVVVEAEGYERFLVEFTLAEGEDRVVEAALRPTPSAPPPAPAPTVHAAPRPRPRTSGFGPREFVVIGESALAVAGLGMGIVFLVKHEGDSADIEALHAAIDSRGGSCVPSERPQVLDGPCALLVSTLADRDRDLTLSVAGFVGAGVFGAAAATTWLLWPTSPAGRGATLSVAPFPNGAMLRGSF